MTKVKDIVAKIESIAPLKLQEDYDNAGYQVGDPEAEVSSIVTCLDITEATVEEAIANGAQMIVSHHPLLFRPIRRITPSDYISRTIIKAIKSNIALYSAHTNLDNAYPGVNFKMAEKLGLNNVLPLATLPADKTAGIENADLCGSGVIGTLSEKITSEQFEALVKKTFKSDFIRTNGKKTAVKKVALCGGSGADFIRDAERKGADVFLTGEIGYHRFFGHEGILLMEAGHFETEQYTCELLKEIIEEDFPNVVVKVSEKQ